MPKWLPWACTVWLEEYLGARGQNYLCGSAAKFRGAGGVLGRKAAGQAPTLRLAVRLFLADPWVKKSGAHFALFVKQFEEWWGKALAVVETEARRAREDRLALEREVAWRAGEAAAAAETVTDPTPFLERLAKTCEGGAADAR